MTVLQQNRAVEKIDVKPEWWDNIFAPSSCLVLITTLDREGHVNAAAFGTCTRVCHDPVHISFTAGITKDTAANVLATGEFVVNVVPFEPEILDQVLVCGLPFKAGTNELDKAGLTALPSRAVRPPRIAQCRSHFECSVAWTKPWLDRVMVCGKVEAVSVDSDCMDEKGFIVWDRLKPAHYCGFRYGNKFVPVFDKPTAAHWHYDGQDSEFRDDENWRMSFQPRG
jgi:flavin reductase (DIM6/NTAB) family NADH-FMN oxidoreductase RutF